MAKKKILVVEGEEDILRLAEYNLSREGFAVTLADSGEACLASIREDPPDLVVLDLMLPGVDGLDVCRILRQNPTTADIPVVMLTAKSEEADAVVGLQLGADDYMVKPSVLGYSPHGSRQSSDNTRSLVSRGKSFRPVT